MNKTVYAKTKYVRSTPRKTRLVVDMIRGKNAVDAYNIVRFANKRAAELVAKTLKSAMANAEHNHGMDRNNLVVSQAFVNEAPTFKRGRAVSKGRYHQILKRNSHIIIGLSEKVVKADAKAEPVKKTAADKKAGKEVKKAEKKTKTKTAKKINSKTTKTKNGK
jgi:large subunit ribosomal protein L22